VSKHFVVYLVVRYELPTLPCRSPNTLLSISRFNFVCRLFDVLLQLTGSLVIRRKQTTSFTNLKDFRRRQEPCNMPPCSNYLPRNPVETGVHVPVEMRPYSILLNSHGAIVITDNLYLWHEISFKNCGRGEQSWPRYAASYTRGRICSASHDI
jgi:hypothetical protein